MSEKEESESVTNFGMWFFWIGLALCLVAIIFPFVVNSFFHDWSKSGTFGDTYGALNALFSGLAFAGVTITILIQKRELENQRIELKLQRTEMQETRREFLLNRTTNLVYNQLEKFERCINGLKIINKDIPLLANDAISELADVHELVSNDAGKSAKKAAFIREYSVCAANRSQIEKFARNAYNSVEVLKRIVFKTDLDVEELNDLKNLFFVNVGWVNMGVIQNISDLDERELELLDGSDYIDNNIEIGQLKIANVFLKSIIAFYNQRLTSDNFLDLKSEWIKSLATYDK